MADRTTAMLDRLPPPYTIDEGGIIHRLLAVIGLQQQVFDEEMDRVQRAHWVDQAFATGDLAKLGRLFDVPPAPWEPRQLYRVRLKAAIAATLRGSVTRAQLERLLASILAGAQQALATRYLELGPAVPDGPPLLPLVEHPERTVRSPGLVGRRGLLRPLDTFEAVNQGCDPVPLQLVLRGVPGDRTAMPLVVNRSNGHALGFRGIVRAGSELLVRVEPDGSVDVRLDGADVTDRAFTTRRLPTDRGGPPLVVDDALLPVWLERGPNRCALVSLARHDDPGLGSAMFGLAADDLHQAAFDEGSWGAAVFAQDAVAAVDAWWVERTPAAFRFDIPAGVVVRAAGARPDPEADRAALFSLLQHSVDVTRAAAVLGEVRAALLREVQPAGDRLTVVSPAATTEVGSAGDDVLVATGALFDETPRDRARFE